MLDGVDATRLPAWFKPPLVNKKDWAKWRPDIAIIPDITHVDLAGVRPGEPEVFLFEIGYCSDTNHNVKYIEKTGQHQALIAALRTAGYKVTVCVITLGTTGNIPTTFLASMNAAGLTLEDSLNLAAKLHRHATRSFQAIVACRRHLEKQDPG